MKESVGKRKVREIEINYLTMNNLIPLPRIRFPLLICMLFSHSLYAQNNAIAIDWNNVTAVSKTIPTLQVVVNPMLRSNSPIHKGSFQALKELGADYVRYVPWFPYPKMAVAELTPPTASRTFWDFTHIDPIMVDFMKATEGHSVVINFSTIPVWMFKTDKPVEFPADADSVCWTYNLGTELRDTTFKELTGYYARLFSWYTKGGFTDEAGRFHKSGHHYKIPYWEVLNEPDLEHNISPQLYTRMYDAIVMELKKISPDTKFIGISVAYESNPEWFEYFLNPANHQPGVPLDGISYHFYGTPSGKEQTIDGWQYSFFDKADWFLDKVRYIEHIRKRLSPGTITTINEIGNIVGMNDQADPVIPDAYWNLAGAMYAHIFLELTKIGVEVAGESQLVGYPSQFPDVSMMNWKNGNPNARYWVLRLLKENFGPGDKLVSTRSPVPEIAAQAFTTGEGRKLLLINKRNKAISLQLPEDAQGAVAQYVDVSTREEAAASRPLNGNTISLDPFSVAVVKFKR